MIVTVTLNAALHVAYTVLAPGTISPRPPLLFFPGEPIPPDPPWEGAARPPVPPRPPRPGLPARLPGGRARRDGGPGAARVRARRARRRAAGGAAGELIIQDLAKSGVPTAFTLIRGESRRFFRFGGPEPGGPVLRFLEPGPYITTEELGRFAADYRRLPAVRRGRRPLRQPARRPAGRYLRVAGDLRRRSGRAGDPRRGRRGAEARRRPRSRPGGGRVERGRAGNRSAGRRGAGHRPDPAGRGRGCSSRPEPGPRGDRGGRVDGAPGGGGR